MPVNPTNKDAKARLATEKKITQEQSKQNKFAEGFRNIHKEIKDVLHDMTLSQQQSFRKTIQTKDIMTSINENLLIAERVGGAEAESRRNIAGWMKEGVTLGAQSLTDVSKHAELQELIEKIEAEKIRNVSKYRGQNATIAEDLNKQLDIAKNQITTAQDFAAEQKRIQDLTSVGTDMLMSGFDAARSKIESMPGGDQISKILDFEGVGAKLKGTIGDNLSTMLDPKNINADKFQKGFQNIGKAGSQAFSKLGQGITQLTATMAANPILLAIIAATVAIIAMIKVVKMGIDRFKALDAAAQDFRETTGMMKSQTEGLDNVLLSVNEKYRASGITIEKAGLAAKSLHETFGRMKEISEDTVGAISLMSANFGIAEKDSAGAMRNLMVMGNMSSEAALNLQAGAIHLAEAAGVAPAEVMEDIANNAGKASKYFGGNTKALVKSAVYARRLGMEMSDMTNMADNLLDFEGSINAQMEASVLLGRQLNFDKARQLALEGDLKGAADAVLDQVGTAADFNRLNVVQKEAIAKAAGLEVGQLEQALIRREEIALLSDKERQEIAKREQLLGKMNKKTRESVLMQKEMQGFSQLLSAFWGKITEIVGNMFLPTIRKVSGWMQSVLENSESTSGFFSTLSTILGVVGSAIGTIFTIMLRWYGLLYGRIVPVFNIITGVIETLKGVFKTIKGIFTGDMDLMKEGLSQLMSGIVGIFKGVFDYLVYWPVAIFKFIKGVFVDIVDFIGGIFGIDSLGGKIVDAISWPFKQVWKIVTAPFKLVWNWLKKIPLLGTMFGGSDEGGAGSGGGFISAIKAPFKLVYDIITAPYRLVWSYLKKIPLIGRLFGGTKDEANSFTEMLTAPFKLVYDIITSPFRLVWNFLKKIPIIGGLFGGSEGGDGGGITGLITSALSGVKNIITAPFRLAKAALSKIPLIGRFFGGGDDGQGASIGGIVSSAFSGVKSVITAPFKLAKAALSKIPLIGRLFGGGGGEDGAGIGDIVSGAFSGIGGKITEGLGAVKDFATSAWDSVKDVGSNVVDGVANMATSAWDGIKGIGEKAKNMGGKAWEGIKGLFSGGKELATSIMDNMPFKNIGSKLSGIVSGFGGDLSESMSGSFTGEKFQGMLKTVQSSVGSVFDSLSAMSPLKTIGGALSDAWGWISGDDGDDGDTKTEVVTPDELNKRILEKLDALIAAVQANGGDIVLDGKKVGTQLAKSTTSPVRG